MSELSTGTEISRDEALDLMERGTPIGHSRIIASGTFLGAWNLPDGTILERYLQFGWKDRFILCAPNRDDKLTSKVTERAW